MKKTILFSAIIVILGVLISIGPIFIFKGCAAGCCSVYPECFWMIKAMQGLGMIITALGIFYVIYNDPKIQLGMTISIFFTGIITLLSAHVILHGCELKSMECNLVTVPVLTGLAIAVIVVSGIKFVSLRKS